MQKKEKSNSGNYENLCHGQTDRRTDGAGYKWPAGRQGGSNNTDVEKSKEFDKETIFVNFVHELYFGWRQNVTKYNVIEQNVTERNVTLQKATQTKCHTYWQNVNRLNATWVKCHWKKYHTDKMSPMPSTYFAWVFDWRYVDMKDVTKWQKKSIFQPA